MKKEWLIAINREHAKIFEIEDGQLIFLKKFENPEGGLRKRDFETHRQDVNRTNQAGNPTVHAMTGEKDPTEHAEVMFASHLMVLLAKEVAEQKVTDLTLAAEPHMAGLLRAAQQSKAPKLQAQWLIKDIANLSVEKIQSILAVKAHREQNATEQVFVGT